MSKPKEYWIDSHGLVIAHPGMALNDEPLIHVIEMSAYEKAIAALKVINKKENTAGACMHIARETLKELGEE